MRVLVTGASGFAGPAVLRALRRAGHHAVPGFRNAAVRGESEFVALPDFARPFDATAIVAGFDAVLHLAGIAHATRAIPESTYDAVNADAVRTLAQASRAAGVRHFVLVSSVRAQSGASADRVLSETDRPAPSDAYGRSKLKGEAAARDALAGSDTSLVILRPVLMYGAGAKGNMGTLIRLAGSPLPLPLGGLTARRSLLGVDNFADALRHILVSREAAGRTFLVADNVPLTVGEIIAALRRGSGRTPRALSVPLPGVEGLLRGVGKSDLAGRLFGNLIVSTEAIRALGWEPPTGVREGLASILRGPGETA